MTMTMMTPKQLNKNSEPFPHIYTMMNDMFEKGTASSSLDLNTLRTEVPHIYGQLNISVMEYNT